MDRVPFIIALVLLLILASPSTAVGKLIRISLESDDHLRFVGTVRVGSLDQHFRVVFDTGSSDTWIATTGLITASKCQRQHADSSFAIHYGTGVVSGFTAQTDLWLGGSDEVLLLLRDVCVGIVDGQTPDMERLKIQGVVGLGMEALGQIHSHNSLLGQLSRQQPHTAPVIFSVYISSWSGAQPSSHLLLGAVDPTLLSPSDVWFSFPVMSSGTLHLSQPSMASPVSPDSFGLGFWAIRLQHLSLDNKLVSLGERGTQHGVALLDSGTSFVLLPPDAFNAASHELFIRFGSRLLPSTGKQKSLLACRSCQAQEFPSIAFAFWRNNSNKSGTTSQRFILQGSDYVRCDHRRHECTAMLDVIQATEVDINLPTVVLGTVFLRAHYARFDYTHKRVHLACTMDQHGTCLGGLNPALDYDGHPHGLHQGGRKLTGVWAAATALALLVGLRILLGLYTKPAASWARK